MSELLVRLQNKYKSVVSENTINNLFKEAQKKALYAAVNNVADCPYGTGNGQNLGVDTSYTSGTGAFADSRKDDRGKINMDQLVQLTLYYFDKLLLDAIANGKA